MMQHALRTLRRLIGQVNNYGDYRLSKHADFYEKIGKQLNTSAQHVYEIAHGKAFRNYDDKVIGHELAAAGIITLNE